MEFRIEKCTMIKMKGGENKNGRNRTFKLEKKQNASREEKLKVLGNVWSGYHQTNVDERKSKTVPETSKKTSRNQTLQRRDLGISTCKVLWTILKVNKEWLMNKRTMKLIIIHKALNPIDDIDRLYVSRKEGRRGLARIKDCVDVLINGFEHNKKS